RGVGHEDVDRAEARIRAPDEPLGVLLARQVACFGADVDAVPDELGRDLVEIVLRTRADADLRDTSARELERDRSAEAARRSAHDRRGPADAHRSATTH